MDSWFLLLVSYCSHCCRLVFNQDIVVLCYPELCNLGLWHSGRFLCFLRRFSVILDSHSPDMEQSCYSGHVQCSLTSVFTVQQLDAWFVFAFFARQSDSLTKFDSVLFTHSFFFIHIWTRADQNWFQKCVLRCSD